LNTSKEEETLDTTDTENEHENDENEFNNEENGDVYLNKIHIDGPTITVKSELSPTLQVSLFKKFEYSDGNQDPTRKQISFESEHVYKNKNTNDHELKEYLEEIKKLKDINAEHEHETKVSNVQISELKTQLKELSN